MPHWKIAIDTGGTFTDCLAEDPNGKTHRLKILSNSAIRGRLLHHIDRHTWQVEIVWPVREDIYTDYSFQVESGKGIMVASTSVALNRITLTKKISPSLAGQTFELSTSEEVPVLAARLLTKTPVGSPIPKVEVRLGSTRGTNAILERKGARTAFITTKGFKDLLLIGNQQRPELFTLNIQKPAPLYHVALEVKERINAQGQVLQPLTQKEMERVLFLLKRYSIQSVAIAFLNSYRNAAHEQQLANFLTKRGYTFVSISTGLSQQIKLLSRAETTVANAYLKPIIHQYLSRIRQGFAHARLQVITSSGSLADADAYQPKDSLLSGPAGGVVGAATVGRQSGNHAIIGFDMGGTSTDVSLYHGRFDYRYESKVGDQKILAPSLAIETIAAGGGSVCDFDGYKFTVGPHSAGAWPGPACYGLGGPLTITDVNLLLGRVNEKQFAMPLSRAAAQKSLVGLLKRIRVCTRKSYSERDALMAFVTIANEKMAEAIKKVSLARGYNPSDFAMVSFGGAGGQHACRVAGQLGISTILIPYDAGLLSAYGISVADIEHVEEHVLLQNFEDVRADLSSFFDQLSNRGFKQLVNQGEQRSNLHVKEKLIFLRFRGQETSLELVMANDVLNKFEEKYREVYGHWIADRAVEVESIQVRVGTRNKNIHVRKDISKPHRTAPTHHQKVFTGSAWVQAPVFEWEYLQAGASLNGPALVSSKNSTTWIEPGWRFFLDGHGTAKMSQTKAGEKKKKLLAEAELELFTNRFTAIAEEMGALLQRASFSVNVKERLDFSCALLDRNGYLVVNAPHIPVHLGSLGVCVRDVKKAINMKPGDVIMTNHPGFGGSHLPDVTLIKPVYVKTQLVGYVANRAHHAEIGGVKPGSMPAFGADLREEGIILSPDYLMRAGKVDWVVIRKKFTDAAYPSRLPEENLADLNAALAALQYGEQALQKLCSEQGTIIVTSFMKKMRRHAADLLKAAINKLPAPSYQAVERLDDGSQMQVVIQKQQGKIRIDFSGTSPQHRGNLNATPAIVQSVVLYVMRLLVNRPIPMNEGLMDLIDLKISASLLNPDFSNDKLPAVVGGNTEVSQRLTDSLLKAFDLAACSQGTMNNFLFGNHRLGYYETIGGGCGAGPGFHGADAVHQHMTNTRITDAEILEHRYPVRLLEFSIRVRSGGRGKWKGGDGIVRMIEFLEPMEVNVLAQHRKEKPYGRHGGQPGAQGQQRIRRVDGTHQKLTGQASVQVKAGDIIEIKTPGGGGWGKR